MTTRRPGAPPAENGSSPALPEAQPSGTPLPEITRTGSLSVRLFPPHGTASMPWITFCQTITKVAEAVPTGRGATLSIKDGLLTVTWAE